MPSVWLLPLLLLSTYQPFDYTNLVVTPDPGVRYVNGVLGYTRDCGFALYPDRKAAITRNQSLAMYLEPHALAAKFSKDEQIGAFAYQYVSFMGKTLSAPAGFDMGLEVTRVLLRSYETRFSYTSESKCIPFNMQPIGVMEAISRASRQQPNVLVYGYIDNERDYHLRPADSEIAKGAKPYLMHYWLYSTREAYEDKVDVRSLRIGLKEFPESCVGRLVLLNGDLGRQPINESYLPNLKNASVVAETCRKEKP